MSGKELVEPPENRLYLGLGSNILPEKNIPAALELLKKHGTLVSQSSLWKSPAVGSAGPDFLNAVVLFLTQLSPDEFKTNVIRKIEADLDRKRGVDKNAPRTIDIDILIVNDEVVDDDVWESPHIIMPLAEIHPELYHPISGKKIADISHNLGNRGKITKLL